MAGTSAWHSTTAEQQAVQARAVAAAAAGRAKRQTARDYCPAQQQRPARRQEHPGATTPDPSPRTDHRGCAHGRRA
ncbi:hypothetical protein GGI08_006767 [Coemansia sp. S2]|nr:hypothetical protein GGI08_006767 [Coemansia sp. S2]